MCGTTQELENDGVSVSGDTAPALNGTLRAVQKMLGESPYSAHRDVVCDDLGGAIRITGQVPSHYLKQIAFSIVCEMSGSMPVINEIKVDGDSARDSRNSGRFRVVPPS